MKIMLFVRIAFALLVLSLSRTTAVADKPLRTITGNDGAEMVFIPSGEFQVGSSADEIKQVWKEALEFRRRIMRTKFERFKRSKFGAVPTGRGIGPTHKSLDDEIPRHTVYLDAFYIDKYEVTNAQYRKFIEATGHREPKYWNEPKCNQPSQPVIGVSWHDAMAYASWAGKRLPTEAEWECAARGGLDCKRYPWGDSEPNEIKVQRHGRDAVPVGSHAPNDFGVFDIVGSILEWCLDEYQEKAYQPDFTPTRPKVNPFVGGDFEAVVKNYNGVETERVLRGGSWQHDFYNLRVADRAGTTPKTRTFLIGFRCAKSATP